jgi:hypothetical protein
MTFLDTCYSYLFGDDDPNLGSMLGLLSPPPYVHSNGFVLDFDVKLDKLIAAVIVSNNGVVVAEQLAPFLRDPPGR